MFTNVAGLPCPMGATPDDQGTYFAVYAGGAATDVSVCLFSADGTIEETRIPLTRGPAKGDGYIWYAHVPEVKEGAVYGYRVDGPFDPPRGHYFNPQQLLSDPYALDLQGEVIWDDALFPYDRQRGWTHANPYDSAPFVPKSRVVDRYRLLEQAVGKYPGRPLVDDVTLELHVKGFTYLFQALPEELRGTYLGLAHPRTIEWLQDMHINAVEIMPATEHVDDERFADHPSLTNYWGYMPHSFFAFHREYASSQETYEDVRHMLESLRDADIEPVLDVVFNHTAEGDHFGPSFNFRGFDHSMYHTVPGRPGETYDTTGTGNTLDASHPFVTDMALDALEYYMALGFTAVRFDLGVALGREGEHVGYDPNSRFFERLQQERAPGGRLEGLKVTGEPWDLGPYGQQQGNVPYAEWSDEARHIIQEAALSWHGTQSGQLAAVLMGGSARSLEDVVNAVLTHDGSTLHDLTAFSQKNNWANDEQNRDGSNEPFRYNHGVEGPTDDPAVMASRQTAQQFAIALVALAQGSPLLMSGNLRGHSKQGNNNTYAQDNALTWLSWDEDLAPWQKNLMQFASRAFGVREKYASLRRSEHITHADIRWWHPDGREMRDEDWHQVQSFAYSLHGNTDHGRQEPPTLVLINGGNHPQHFIVPPAPDQQGWSLALDSANITGTKRHATYQGGDTITLPPRSLQFLEVGTEKSLMDAMTSGQSEPRGLSM